MVISAGTLAVGAIISLTGGYAFADTLIPWPQMNKKYVQNLAAVSLPQACDGTDTLYITRDTGCSYQCSAGTLVLVSCGGAGSGDITDVWGCTTGNCNALTAASGDTMNATSADSAIPWKAGTSPPGTCSVAQSFFDTDATAGQNIYACTSTNIWTLEGGAGGGGNSFATLDAPSGTDPVADSATDTLLLTATAPITVTGDSAADSLTFAVADASVSVKGVLQLGGDLGGTATSQTIQADSVALGTDTTGGYAGSTTEGGTATTATALVANGSNCSAGSAAAGVDAAGVAEGCAAFVPTSRTLTGGAGIAVIGDLSADRTIATDSTEADFIANGTLTCGAGTRGKIQVNSTTPMQYCDGSTPPTLRYIPHGNSVGTALTASALAANGINCSAGTYPLGVDASGASETCTADDDIPEAGDLQLALNAAHFFSWEMPNVKGAGFYQGVGVTNLYQLGNANPDANIAGITRMYLTHTTVASANQPAGVSSDPITWSHYNPTVIHAFVRTGASISNSMIWFEMRNPFLPIGTPHIPPIATVAYGTAYVGAAYQNGVNGGRWICASGNGTNESGTDMGGSVVAVNTEYELVLTWNGTSNITCSATGAGTIQKTTNLPLDRTGGYRLGLFILTTEAVAKSLSVARINGRVP